MVLLKHLPSPGILPLLVLFSGLLGCGSNINEPEDVTPPGLAYTIPSDGDVNVSTTVAPKVGFNEAIKYAGNGFFLVNVGQNVQGASRLTEGKTDELCFIPNQPLDEGQVYIVRLDGSKISDVANNAYNSGQMIDISSFTTSITTGINPPDALSNFTGEKGNALNEVILNWEVPSDLNNKDVDASKDLSFKIYRSNKPITSQNDISSLVPIATVGTGNQGEGAQITYSDRSGGPGKIYHYAIQVMDKEGNKTLSPLIDPAVSKGYSISDGWLIDGVRFAANDGETKPFEVDLITQDGRPLYLEKDDTGTLFSTEIRKPNGTLVFSGNFHTVEIPYENASATQDNDTGDNFRTLHGDAPILALMAPYRRGDAIPNEVKLNLLANGEIPTVYFNVGAIPEIKDDVYKKNRDASVISKALVGGHNWLEDIKPGQNTEDPGANSATDENEIRDNWRNMELGYPDKKILVLGSIYQALSVNSVDSNGRGYLRVKNTNASLMHFITERYSQQMNGITDVPRHPEIGSVPGDFWSDTYIDQPPNNQGFDPKLNEGPISDVGYDLMHMPKEELLAQVAKGLNEPFLRKNNGNYSIKLNPISF